MHEKQNLPSVKTGWRIFLSSLPNYNSKLDLITSDEKSTAAFLNARPVTGSEVATQIERLTTCAALRERERKKPRAIRIRRRVTSGHKSAARSQTQIRQ
jgi:hypothetical protein